MRFFFYLALMALLPGCDGFSIRSSSTAPESVQSLAIVYPLSTSHWERNLVVRVSPTSPGEEIKIYSDSSCLTEVGSESATGTQTDVGLSGIRFGTHNLYARRMSSSGASSCSLVSATYERECPSTGYVPVEPTSGVDDFCVMKFEARDDGSGVTPESTPVGNPWTNISQEDAILACASLGTGHALINNDEWMAMALDVEGLNTNWSTNTQGSGHLPSGQSDPGSGLLGTIDESDHWSGTGDSSSSGWHQRRTFFLSNGSMVWDLAGNAFEWIDWTIDLADKAYDATDGGPVVSVRSLDLIDSNISPGDVMEQSKWLPAGHPYPLSSRMGGYFADNSGEPADVAVARGGSHGMGNGSEYSGVFTMAIVRRVNEPRANVGFRCVFRP